jgi:glycosyltransferase involved in cell wall biosynthesis
MKTVLIIAYYFPPSVDAGAKRALGFQRHLADHGYRPLVLTVAGGNYLTVGGPPAADEADVFRVRCRRLPWQPARRAPAVGGAPVPEGSLRRIARRLVREVAYVPDAFAGFFRPACDRALTLAREQRIDLLFTMSSPYTSLRIGHELSRRLHLPWVADLRDLWTRHHAGYYYSLLRRKADEYLERRWLSRADRLTTVSGGLQRILQTQFPGKPVACIHNGFLGPLPESPAPAPGQGMRITFTGTLYEEFDHSIRPLCAALRAAEAMAPDALQGLSVQFLGSVNRSFTAVREEFQLQEVIHYLGRVGPAEVARIQQDSDVLLVLIPEDQVDSLPTKTFEYMASGRPILLVGPREGEAARLLETTRSGRAFAPSQIQEIARFLLELREAKRAQRAIRSEVDPGALESFSYRSLAGKLAGVFNSVLGAEARA